MTVDQTRDLFSIGKAGEILQLVPPDVEALAARLGLCAAVRINGICYFNAEQLRAMRELLAADRAAQRTGGLSIGDEPAGRVPSNFI